jgi:hypothetical protein
MLPMPLLYGGQFPRDARNHMSFPRSALPHQEADDSMKWRSCFSLCGVEYFKMAAIRLGSADSRSVSQKGQFIKANLIFGCVYSETSSSQYL